MKTKIVRSTLAVLAATLSSHGAIVNFSYSQSDATTGSGTIAPFSFGGHDFTATPLPAATVFSPGTVIAPSGFVGSITGQAGAANEANQAVGLLWSGTVTATATDGATIQIPLTFAPKQTQTPTDLSDYSWNIAYGDAPASGIDTTITAARMAMYFSRDTTLDAAETANTFQRYTQQNMNFVAGQDTFSNTTTSSTAIKDAQDPAGAPLGTDAVGRNLEFYWAWRDTGTLNAGGAILVDQFDVGGILVADEATLVVPEPSTMLLGLAGAGCLLAWRRRKA